MEKIKFSAFSGLKSKMPSLQTAIAKIENGKLISVSLKSGLFSKKYFQTVAQRKSAKENTIKSASELFLKNYPQYA